MMMLIDGCPLLPCSSLRLASLDPLPPSLYLPSTFTLMMMMTMMMMMMEMMMKMAMMTFVLLRWTPSLLPAPHINLRPDDDDSDDAVDDEIFDDGNDVV